MEVESQPSAKERLHAHIPEEQLLAYGVPSEWLGDVRKADEDSILELAVHLPAEAAEALLNLSTGVTPQVIQPVAADTNPFEHPDAQRRFRAMNNQAELDGRSNTRGSSGRSFFIPRSDCW